jgi:hypothetical protein
MKKLTNQQINLFISEMQLMKRLNANYMSASDRKRAHARFTMTLEGVDANGREINARLYCDISCRYNRSTAPIFINGKKSNIRGLKNSLTKAN